MATGTSFKSTASQYARALSRHLANHIVAGLNCDETIVRACCEQTLQDLQLPSQAADDRNCTGVESTFVEKVATLLQSHQRFLSSMPPAVASTFITELLLERAW